MLQKVMTGFPGQSTVTGTGSDKRQGLQQRQSIYFLCIHSGIVYNLSAVGKAWNTSGIANMVRSAPSLRSLGPLILPSQIYFGGHTLRMVR